MDVGIIDLDVMKSYHMFHLLWSATNCSGSNQQFAGTECFTFITTHENWNKAVQFCSLDVGNSAILAPTYDYEQLVEIRLKIETANFDSSSSRWYGISLFTNTHLRRSSTVSYKWIGRINIRVG